MGADGGDFAAELARLKRRGSAVLVCDGGGGLGVCTDLLGSEDAGRRRVLARSADDAVLPVPPTGATIVEVSPAPTRAAAATGPAAFDPDAVLRDVDASDGIDALVGAVGDAAERVAADGVEPGVLRVCLGRLDGFFEREDPAVVAAALGRLWDRVRDHAGMGHAHVSGEPAGAVARPFDVTVETRTTPGGVRETRWQVHAAGLDTGWVRTHGG